METKFIRNCPKCNKEIFYSNRFVLQRASEKNTLCNKGRCNNVIPVDGWFKFCPLCGDKQKYLEKWNLEVSIKNNSLCRSCSLKGKRHTVEHNKKISDSNKGVKNHFWEKKHFTKTKQKISFGMVGKNKGIKNGMYGKKCNIKNHSIETKKRMSLIQKSLWKNPIIRKKRLSSIKWNNITCDKGQLELLNKWNTLGFNFQPNYKLYTDDFLCYIDGYDKEKNIVCEYDTKYHFRKDIKQKDLVRQQKIIEILKPKKFWRYNSIYKTWENVLKGLK